LLTAFHLFQTVLLLAFVALLRYTNN
jgi:hypothetical protein